MGVARSRTIKNKHAANKSGIRGSKATRKAPIDGVVTHKPKGTAPKHVRPLTPAEKLRKRTKLKKSYTAEMLGVPKLNMITPLGVTKPRGKKKGKVFVDDKESMATIMAMVQAEKEGEIESKLIKARQMEEIREARKEETERKEKERKEKLEDAKNSLRKKRKRKAAGGDDGPSVKQLALAGSKTIKQKKKKVAFA